MEMGRGGENYFQQLYFPTTSTKLIKFFNSIQKLHRVYPPVFTIKQLQINIAIHIFRNDYLFSNTIKFFMYGYNQFIFNINYAPVSYTHLDVYKRQVLCS